MQLFKPFEILNIYHDLNIQSIKDRGFKIVFIDIDNTIALPNVGDFTDEAKTFVKNIIESGMRPVIISNNTKKRVINFIKNFDIDYVYFALKPLPFCFWNVCKKYNCSPKKCVVIGDQLLTDILGANLSGCYGIYSKQLHEKDTPLTRFNRHIEKIIWRYILHEKM